MDDDLFLISYIEGEYKKLSLETKKKYPTRIKELVDFALKTIENIKSTISNPTATQNPEIKKKFVNDLQLSMDIIIKPILFIAEGKYSKLNLSCILILKKLITYNYITELEINNVIKILKEMFDNSNEDTQLKILEALQSLISINVIKVSEETLNNIMIIFCHIFCFKNIETKNALQLILGTFMKKIFEYADDNAIITLIKNLVYLSENIKKDWINTPSISSKCLGLELITTIIETNCDKFKRENFQTLVNEDIRILIQKIFAMYIDQPMICIKICRLTIVIINNLNMCHDLVGDILKLLNKNTSQVLWKKILGLECLCELFKNTIFLYDLFINYKELYERMLTNFTDVCYKSFMMKSKSIAINGESSVVGAEVNIPLMRKQFEINLKMPNKKYLANNLIIIDENISITQNMNYVYKLLTDCFDSLKTSFVALLEQNGLSVNVNALDKIKKEQKSKHNNNINNNNSNKKEEKAISTLTEKQKQLQEMISIQFVDIKGGLICMLININDITIVQTFIQILQTFIYIYTSFDLTASRDELLDDLCKLAIPNNLENIFEIKEKNILIIRAIFNLLPCINLLDYNSWLIIIETIENIYYILIKSHTYYYDYKEQFNINTIINNLVSNIKKYNYHTDIGEIQQIIQENENKNNNGDAQNILPELNVINNNNINKDSKLKRKNTQGISSSVNNAIKPALNEEQKENIEILSNVVNNLFIESNDYDNDTLLTIIKVFYEITKKIFDSYLKEKKESKKVLKESININNITNINNTNNIITINNNNNNNNIINNENNRIASLTTLNKDNNNPNNQKDININKKMGRLNSGGKNFNINMNNPYNNMNMNANNRLSGITGLTNTNNMGGITSNNNININNISINNNSAQINQNSNNNSIQNEKLLMNLTYINFNLVKVLDITIININRIDIIWNIISDLVNLLSSNSINNRFSNTLSKFTIEILIQIIITVINQYKNFQNGNESNNNSIISSSSSSDSKFSSKQIQITVFKPIFTFLNRHHNISFVLEPLSKILAKCSMKLNTLGWNCFINILNQILSNEKVDSSQCESVFKMVEQIFNEYSIYLNMFNIDHILNVIEKFSVSKDNSNICYSSIALFWQCADICENFQKSKKVLKKEELELFDDIKLSTDEDKNKFYGDLWKNIFFKLININNDERFDIRKSGINVFSQFYVAKIKSMNILYDTTNTNNLHRKISAEIIYEIFFEIVNKNFKSFLNYYKYNNDKELTEWENTIVITLQAIGKVIKSYIEENKEGDNKENNPLFLKFIDKSLELMKSNTPLISMNILKNLTDIEVGDDKIYLDNLESNWKILDSIGSFIVDENLFVKKHADSVPGEKLIENIVETLRVLYYKKIILEKEENIFNKEIEKLILYLPKVFLAISFTETNYINANPRVLIPIEKDIFELLEEEGKKIRGGTLIQLIKYLMTFINFDIKKPHSEILCRRSMGVLGTMFKNNSAINEIEGGELSKIILDIIDLTSPIFGGRTNIDIVSYIINTKKPGSKYFWNDLVEQLLFNIIEPIVFDIKNQTLWEKIINLFNDLLNQNQTINTSFNDKPFIPELMKSCQNIETNIVNFIINSLLPKSFFIDQEFQNKLLSLIDIDNNNNESNNKISPSSLSINKICLYSLFDICKFKSSDDIHKDFFDVGKYLKEKKINEIKDDEIKKRENKYIEMKTGIAKKSMPLLLKKCKDEMKKFLENEKKGANNENDIDLMKNLLASLKNMDYINKGEENDKENLIMKQCLKSKKGHLFELHFILSEFIDIQNNEIKNIIKDIFKIMSQEMGLNE